MAHKGLQNLRTAENSFALYDKERLREVSRRGAERTAQIKREKQSARAALERLLSMKATDEIINGAELPEELAEKLKQEFPDATLNDLLQCVALGNALAGDMRALEFCRDTIGEKPSTKVDMLGDNDMIMTENDRKLLEKVSARLEQEDLIIAKDVTGDY